MAVAWHPTRSCLVSLTTTGRVLVWSLVYTENWSAFAPDFKVSQLGDAMGNETARAVWLGPCADVVGMSCRMGMSRVVGCLLR